MPSLNAWAGDSFPLSAWSDDYDMGVDTARLIADKSTSITVTRAGTPLAAQTVRIETLTGDRRMVTSGGTVYAMDALVVGYKSHPTVTNTDLKPGDRFYVDSTQYEVITLMPGLTDSLQAYCQVRR